MKMVNAHKKQNQKGKPKEKVKVDNLKGVRDMIICHTTHREHNRIVTS